MRCCAAVRQETNPASRSTFRCFDTAGWLTASVVDELADAALGAAELVEDPPPGRLREHGERVDWHRLNMPLTLYACQGL